MQILKNKDKIANIIFIVGVLIHTFVMAIELGDFSIPFRGRLLQVAFLLFCIKIIMTLYSKKEWIVMVLLGLLGVVSYICGAEEYVLSIVVMIFASKSTDIKKVLKYVFYITLIASFIIIALSLIGIGGVVVDIRDYGRGGIEARWCLGFGHANNLHGTLWYLISLFVWLYFEKLNWKYYVGLTVLNIAMFVLTVSKAGVLVTQIVILIACLLRYYKEIEKKWWAYLCGMLIVLFMVVISIISAGFCWLDSPVLTLLDRALTGRINLAYQYANISMWRYFSPAGELGVVDNGFVAIFFKYGYVIGIVYILFITYLIYQSWKMKNGLGFAILMTSLFYTFMESSYMINDAYLLANLTFIVAMVYMSNNNQKVISVRG